MRRTSFRRRGGQLAAVAVLALGVSAGQAAAADHGGAPTVTHETFTDTFFDDLVFDACGVSTMTTTSGRITTTSYPDGTVVQHVNVTFVPEDPSIASERDVAHYVFAPDGTVTITGAPIRLYRQGEGTIVRDAGWLKALEDEILVHGPHPFFLTDGADRFYC